MRVSGSISNDSAQTGSSEHREVECLSSGLEILIAKEQETAHKSEDDVPDIDVVIVGSGYGGAMAAAELARFECADGQQPRICLLERGRERLPGSFPESLADLPGEVRLHTHGGKRPYGNLTGLFDVRLGTGCSTLVANGLGGGSLINAGVMLPPTPEVMQHTSWPKPLREDLTLPGLFDETSTLLGATLVNNGRRDANTVSNAQREPRKYNSLRVFNDERFKTQAVPITVSLNEDDFGQAVKTHRCIDCGDCFSGCNHGAKKSLDTNLLTDAKRRGVEIYSGATVMKFDLTNQGTWKVHITHTDKSLRKHLRKPFVLHCRTLVIGAGTLGSSELLMRSEQQSNGRLTFSSLLGDRFSGNGDMLALISDRSDPVHAVSNSQEAPSERHIGPTITGMIDRREACGGVVIQELAVPGLLRDLLRESTDFARMIGALTRTDLAKMTYSDSFLSLLLKKVDVSSTSDANVKRSTDALDYISVLALMGDDEAKGRLDLTKGALAEGTVSIEFHGAKENSWNTKNSPSQLPDSFYERNMRLIRKFIGEKEPNAWVHSNPIWQPLGETLKKLFDVEIQGAQLTVHPLGGCCMGEDALSGVVDHNGRVYRADRDVNSIYDGLVVLDGSIIPRPLGINPALTITTLALRAARNLARSWGWRARSATAEEGRSPNYRSHFLDSRPNEPRHQRPTMVELSERLCGPLVLKTPSGIDEYVVELRLRSEPWDIAAANRFENRNVQLLEAPSREPLPYGQPNISTLRIYHKKDWDRIHDIQTILSEREVDPKSWLFNRMQLHRDHGGYMTSRALFIAPVSGTIHLLEETPLPYRQRMLQAASAWFRNRGFRDLTQRWIPVRSGKGSASLSFKRETFAVFAHSGRERRLTYDLMIGKPVKSEPLLGSESWQNQRIVGAKRFRYARRSNPWQQLMEMDLSLFPTAQLSKERTLMVDAEYFAQTEAPLIHVVSEDNAVSGYADLFAFYAHTARVFLLHHLWALRKPDESIAATTETTSHKALPGQISDLVRTTHRLKLPRGKLNGDADSYEPDNSDQGVVEVLLTRYQNPSCSNTDYPPVLCIHGYSASGTTYAHPHVYGGTKVKGGLARYLCDRGHDVWVLDMRCSCGLETASMPWDFEHMADWDIPAAIEFVCTSTKRAHVDIVAHCMGAVMFSMSMLDEHTPEAHPLKKQLSTKVRNIVLSQAGPYLKFSVNNSFRAYLLSYIRFALDDVNYRFSYKQPPSAGETLFDRLLSTLPYPDKREWDEENPFWGFRRWVGIRHRMDALYGQTFTVKNMSKDVLDRLDEFFGEIHLRTLQQTLSISKRKQLSNRYGDNFNLNKDDFRRKWQHPTLWLHGERNGLVDPISPAHMALIFDQCLLDNIRFLILPGRGHQDSLIGKDCSLAFSSIQTHLSSKFGGHKL